MVAFSVNPANLRKAIQDAQTSAAASKKAPTPTAVVQRAAPTASYVPGFTPSLTAAQKLPTPIANTTVPASSAGLGIQSPQPVAATTTPASNTDPATGLPSTVKVYDRNLGYIDMPNPAIEQAAMAAMQNDWMSRPYSQAFRDRVNYDVYDPATAEYMRGLDAYVRQFGLSDTPAMNIGGMTLDPKKITYKERSQFGLLPEYAYQDINNPVPAMPYGASLPPGIGNYSPTDYASRISAAVTGKTPYEQLLEYQFAIAPHDEDQNTQWANARYNTPIALVDNRTGKVVHAGVGFDAAMKVAELSQNLSNTQGRKASYSIFTADPGTTNWKYQAGDKPDKSVLGQIASVALPALGAILLPGVGGLAGALGSAGAAGVGAAAGSALSGALQGQSIGDILKNAAIAGGATFAGGSLLGGAGGGGTGAITTPGAAAGSTAGTTAGAATGALAGEAAPIVVEGIRQGLTPALGGLLSGSAGALSNWNALTGGAPAPTQPPQVPAPEQPGITVVGQPGATVPGAGAVTGALTGAITPPSTSANIPEATGEPITVEATKPPVVAPVGALTGAVTGAVTPPPVSPSAPELVGEPITVEATKPPTAGATAGSLIGGTSLLTPGQNAVVDQALQGETTPEAKSDLQKVIDYLRLGGLGMGLIGDLLGGKGGSTSPGVMPGGGALNPVFSGSLPAANLPTATPRPATALPQTTQDWYRYGYGPEQSFFSNVPQGAPNTSTAYTGYAEGGEVDDDQRIARMLIRSEQERTRTPERRNKPTFRTEHNYDEGGLRSRYEAEMPIGEQGALRLAAMGEGLSPDMFELAARMGGLRASHMLGGGSQYGYSTPLAGGDLDINVYSPQGFMPRGIRASYRKQFEDGGFAVGGPGDGRDDKIPAVLSDGEYVMDAETVAMLGNGSSKAGAEALDKFRVNIRKHKGRDLAKGKFSANAKKPEQYLKGRK